MPRKKDFMPLEKKDFSSQHIKQYKGLWKPLPKPISKMSRDELVKNLRSFRNAWERITERNVDLDNDRLKSETTPELRSLLRFYYSKVAKDLAAEWLNLPLETHKSPKNRKRSKSRRSKSRKRSRKRSRKSSRSKSRKRSRSKSRKRSRRNSRKRSRSESKRMNSKRSRKMKNVIKMAGSCVRKTSTKYITRKSPAYKAAACAGQRKMGNDGKMWHSKAGPTGIFKWIRV